MSVNSYPDQHEMQLEKIYPSGAEEWFCPVCGRRVIMRWPPVYQQIVLEAGDESAVHSGSKGGLRMRSARTNEEEEEEPILSEELRAALEEILANVDLDNWPSTAD